MSSLARARIGQIAIVCDDVARATAFYRDTLGLRFLFAAGANLSFFECGSVRLMLSSAAEEASDEPRMSSMVYYFIENIEALHAELSAKGVTFIGAPHMIAQMPDHQLWLAEFRDSEGNVLALMEEKR